MQNNSKKDMLPQTFTAVELEDDLEEMEESLEKIHRSGQRLPLILFLATFLGSLLGFAANLSDATGLVIPALELVDPSPELRIIGSSTVLGEGIGMAAEWQEEFEIQHKETVNALVDTLERTVKITINDVGSVEGCKRATEGQVDLLVASEALSSIPQCQQDLAAAGIEIKCAAEIGYDIIAFVTDINNIVPEISTRDMASILNGSITDWSQVGGDPQPIRILARRGSGTTEIVLKGFTGSGEFRPYFIECQDNDHCLDTALSTSGSLYWVGVAWLHTQPPRYLRPILIRRDPRLPAEDPLKEIKGTGEDTTPFNPDNYPRELTRPLYMYALEGDPLDPRSTALAEDFLRYVRGVRGQEILEKNHFYTHFDPPPEVEVELLPGFEAGPDGLPLVCR